MTQTKDLWAIWATELADLRNDGVPVVAEIGDTYFGGS